MDLKCCEKPTTLVPCGHTFCESCVDTMKEENFNVLKCGVCTETIVSSYKNEQLERIMEQFKERKKVTMHFNQSIKALSKYHPEKYEIKA